MNNFKVLLGLQQQTGRVPCLPLGAGALAFSHENLPLRSYTSDIAMGCHCFYAAACVCAVPE